MARQVLYTCAVSHCSALHSSGADAEHMEINVRHRPAYSLAYVLLDSSERVFVERSAMAAMSGGVSVRASTGGSSLVKAVSRHTFGGESFVFSCFEAELTGAWVALAPTLPGDIDVLRLDGGQGLLIQTGSLLAYSEGVDVSMRYGGVRGMLIQEGVAFLHATGEGDVVISSYGAIEQLQLGDDEQLIVDSGHLVAFSAGVRFEVGPLGSIATAALTGEGLVARFTGPGTVIIQTRAEQQLRDWLLPDRGQNKS